MKTVSRLRPLSVGLINALLKEDHVFRPFCILVLVKFSLIACIFAAFFIRNVNRRLITFSNL